MLEFKPNTHHILNLIKKVQCLLNISNEEMSEVLQIKVTDFNKLILKNSEPDLTSLIGFAQYFKLSLDKIILNTYSTSDLYNHFYKPFEMPERYLANAESYRVAAKYMLDYIKVRFGEESYILIMKKLGLTDYHFENLAGKNNIQLTLDLCHEVFYKAHRLNIREMGHNFFETFKNSDKFLPLKNCRNGNEVFEKMIYDIAPKNLENNYFWRIIKKDYNKITIEGEPNNDVYSKFNFSFSDLQNIQSLREGLISSLPKFLNNPTLKTNVKTIKAYSEGSSKDVFEVSFETEVYH